MNSKEQEAYFSEILANQQIDNQDQLQAQVVAKLEKQVIKPMQRELSKNQKEIQSLQQQLQTVKGENIRVFSGAKVVERANDTLRKQLSEKEKAIVSLQERLELYWQKGDENFNDLVQLRSENQRLTAEVERLKEAAKELVHLHVCEQEGLSSGRPTPAQWLQAVDNLSNLIYP